MEQEVQCDSSRHPANLLRPRIKVDRDHRDASHARIVSPVQDLQGTCQIPGPVATPGLDGDASAAKPYFPAIELAPIHGMHTTPAKQDRPARGFGPLGHEPLGERRTLLQLLQYIRNIDPATLQFDRSHDEFPATPEHEENEVASLAPAPMSFEGLVRIDDDALIRNVLKEHPTTIPRARPATVTGTDFGADAVKNRLHSIASSAAASANRFCSSDERL